MQSLICIVLIWHCFELRSVNRCICSSIKRIYTHISKCKQITAVFFVTVCAGMAYQHLFSREDKIFLNVYNERISYLRTGTLKTCFLMNISNKCNKESRGEHEMFNKQRVIIEIYSC